MVRPSCCTCCGGGPALRRPDCRCSRHVGPCTGRCRWNAAPNCRGQRHRGLAGHGDDRLVRRLDALGVRRHSPCYPARRAGMALASTGAVVGLGSDLTLALSSAVVLLAACARLMPVAGTSHRRATAWRRDALLTMFVSGWRHHAHRLDCPARATAVVWPGGGDPRGRHVDHRLGACTERTCVGWSILRAYLQGLMAKVAFLGALAWLLPRELGPTAWLVAAACGLALLLALSRRRAVAAAFPLPAIAAVPLATSPQPARRSS